MLIGVPVTLDAQKIGKASALCQQLGQRTKPGRAIGIHKQNAVKTLQLRQPVRHANAHDSTPLAKDQIARNPRLGAHIECRERIVQNNHVGRVQGGTRQ